MNITSHVLDLASGKPAAGIAVTLEKQSAGGWSGVGAPRPTDADGRVKNFAPPGPIAPGRYRLGFDAGGYFKAKNVPTFYGVIQIEFVVRDATPNLHVPLLLSPFGYSTYRGS